MSLYQLPVDSNLRECFFYEDPSFPFGVWIDHYQYCENHGLPYHWHEDVEYELLLQGQAVITVNDTPYLMNPGDGLFIGSSVLHKAQQLTENTVMLVITLTPSMLANGMKGVIYQNYTDPGLLRHVSSFRIHQDSSTGLHILDLLKKLQKLPQDAFGYELIALSHISMLWLHTLQYIHQYQHTWPEEHLPRQTHELKQLLEYIHNHYAEPITIHTLLSHVPISRTECFRCFKHYTGLTPIEYINNYRLSQAADMLQRTSLSIIEICMACGFTSQSYFGKLFKERYQISPLQYRKER